MAEPERQRLINGTSSRTSAGMIIACSYFLIYIFLPVCYIVLVSIGGFLKSTIEQWSFFTQADLSLVTSLIISAGSLGIIFVSFGWCSGDGSHIKVMSVIAPLLLIIQIIAVIYGCLQVADGNKYLLKSINADMKEKFMQYPGSDDVQRRFNEIQNGKECCGVFSVQDYKDEHVPVPISCCSLNNMAKVCTDPTLIYPRGCASVMYHDVTKYIGILSYVTIALIILQILPGISIIKMIMNTISSDDD